MWTIAWVDDSQKDSIRFSQTHDVLLMLPIVGFSLETLMKLLLLTLLLWMIAPAMAQTYGVTGSIPLGGSGAWDYLRADADSRRLYVSHSTEVVVLDLDNHKVVGRMTGFGFIHGIVIVKKLNIGFLSDGQKNEVVAFDPNTRRIKDRIKTVANPNSMVYNATTDRLFVGHKPSKSITVIQASTGQIVKSIPLGGVPEYPVSDERSVFVNIEDKNEILRIDANTLAITAHFPLAPCESPSGLAIDQDKHRLFAACDNKLMAIVNAETGAVVSTVPIKGGPDAAAFDEDRHLAFSSNGEGSLTVIADEGSDHYRVVQDIATEQGARTMAVDVKTHVVFLSAAKLGPPPTPTAENPQPPNHPTALPGTFKLLMVSPKL